MFLVHTIILNTFRFWVHKACTIWYGGVNYCVFRLEIIIKDKFTKEQIENMLKTSTEQIVDGTSTLVDEFGNSFDVNQAIDVAKTHIKKKYPKINFRWSEGM